MRRDVESGSSETFEGDERGIRAATSPVFSGQARARGTLGGGGVP